MPSNAGHAAKRSVVGPGDDAQDEFQLEAELSRLQRQLHVMEGDRRAYSEESCNILRKQMAEILALKAENEEIGKVLKLADSEGNQTGDSRDIETLISLTEKLDDYERLCKKEEREIKALQDEVLVYQEMINDERKLLGNKKEADSELIISKRLRVTENRLDQALIKFNNQLAINARLREELDHLRQEKSVFDVIHKRLSKGLQETKSEISESIAEASHAYEERDEAQTKMIALKERSDKDHAQQEMEMKELLRIIKHDDKLKEFMGIKVHDRQDLRDEETAKKKKGKDAVDKDKDADRQSIRQLEQAFSRIKEATGEGDINKIVSDFIRKEDQNFALYNYVNELNDTLENIQEEIKARQSEIQRFQDDDVKSEENRRKMIREMELAAEKFSQDADDADKKNVTVCKVLDEIRVGVEKLFKEAECDPSTISDMLGSEEGVTYKNILQYMGIIEQRTMELIKIQQYIQMLKEPPKQEKKDGGKSQATPPASQPNVPNSPRQPQVSIFPPNTTEDEDLLDDGELRPLTRDEIKSMVMKTINTKIQQSDMQRKANNKRNKAKSP